MRNQQTDQLMRRINEASFAMDDVVLYLDTHPDDINALNFYHQVAGMRNEAVRSYEEQCGPLMVDGVRNTSRWTWESEKWPWEGEM